MYLLYIGKVHKRKIMSKSGIATKIITIFLFLKQIIDQIQKLSGLPSPLIHLLKVDTCTPPYGVRQKYLSNKGKF